MTYVDDEKKTVDKHDYPANQPFGMFASQFGVGGLYEPGGMVLFQIFGFESFFLGKTVWSPAASGETEFFGRDCVEYKIGGLFFDLRIYLDQDREVAVGWKTTAKADPGAGQPKAEVATGQFTKMRLNGEALGEAYLTQRQLDEKKAARVTVGSKLRDFSMRDLNGKPVSLAALAKQYKALLVNFWHLGCPPCREEMPQFAAMARELKGRKVYFVSVNMHDAQAKPIRSFLMERSSNIPTLMASDKWKAVMDAYGILSYPTLFLLDSGLQVRQKYQFFEPARIREDLKGLGILPGSAE